MTRNEVYNIPVPIPEVLEAPVAITVSNKGRKPRSNKNESSNGGSSSGNGNNAANSHGINKVNGSSNEVDGLDGSLTIVYTRIHTYIASYNC